MAWQAGDHCGRYELRALLGRGGGGEVWEATLHGPSGFRKDVALKLLRDDGRTASAREHLRREARLGALLSHPNLAATLELGEAHGIVFIAMELVRGLTVLQLAQRAPLPASAVLELGMQTCAGLHHLHVLRVDGRDSGMVHRDIKPSNLLVDRYGRLKIADLGIAIAPGAQEHAEGTRGYAAPEQIAGAAVDGRADLFALGAALYLLTTRTPPFPGGSSADAAAALLARPGAFDVVDDKVPGLGDVLRGVLGPRPQDRYADALAFAAALGSLVERQAPGPTLFELVSRGDPELAPPGAGQGPASPTLPTVILHGDLPNPDDRFFGRRALLEQVLDEVRRGPGRVVLHGPGGMGKTRLAVEAARAMTRELPGGAWFFDLSEAHSVDALCTAIARSLGVDLDRGDPLARIGYTLHARGRALFVLDNLEQLDEHAGAAVARLASLAPEACLLCTTRVALDSGARVEVGPLDPEAAADLFIDRAARRPGREERPTVVRIVRRIDCMPLAIELCAARTQWLQLADLEAHLSERLRVTSTPSRGRPARHRSVRAALEGSWVLVSDVAARALAQLSVFEGGFTAQAADAVLELDCWALDALQELADASLVTFDAEQDRFALLQLVKDFAAEQLDPAARLAAEERHGALMAQWGSLQSLDALRCAGGVAHYARLAAEIDNLVAATERAAARGDGDVAVPAALAAWAILDRVGPYRRGEELIRAALPCAGRRGAELHMVLAETLTVQGELVEALEMLGDTLAAARAQGHEPLVQRITAQRAGCLMRLGHTDNALLLLQEALAFARSRGDRLTEASLLGQVGLANWELGRTEEGARCYEAALRMHRSLGDRRSEGVMLGRLALREARRGAMDEARALYAQALEAARESGNRGGEVTLHANLASLMRMHGHFDEARRLLQRALTMSRRMGSRRVEAAVLTNLGTVSGDGPHDDSAIDILSLAVATAREVGALPIEVMALYNLAEFTSQAGKRAEARRILGELMPVASELGDRTTLVLAHSLLGSMATRDGDLDVAADSLTRAVVLAREAGDLRGEGIALSCFGKLAWAHGRPEEGRGHLRAATVALEGAGDQNARLLAMYDLVRLELEVGDSARARAVLEEMEAALAGLDLPLGAEAEAAVAKARAACAI